MTEEELQTYLNSNNDQKSWHLIGAQIGDKDARAIAEALQTNSKLTHLDLENNDIGVDGATEIEKALTGNTTLTTLYLPYNNIGVEGARAIAGALKETQLLQPCICETIT